MEAGDAHAIYNLGIDYRYGGGDVPQDYTKALELWDRAAKLGYAKAYANIGCSYEFGKGVEVDKKKAVHYFELAAMGGDAIARHNLGVSEGEKGNKDRALKHYMIAVRGGFGKSLEIIKLLYSNGQATKEDYTKALQSYQAFLMEIKSPQRDKAVAFDEDYRYY